MNLWGPPPRLSVEPSSTVRGQQTEAYAGLLERKITRAKISGVNLGGDFDFDPTLIEQRHRL
jgi:hypothetical protein